MEILDLEDRLLEALSLSKTRISLKFRFPRQSWRKVTRGLEITKTRRSGQQIRLSVAEFRGLAAKKVRRDVAVAQCAQAEQDRRLSNVDVADSEDPGEEPSEPTDEPDSAGPDSPPTPSPPGDPKGDGDDDAAGMTDGWCSELPKDEAASPQLISTVTT
ncbi:hypothetical protein PAPYR_12451 [Paratrimastix pyriformis]|uniref:Uncharacterized protein n=1 Tax=Paratrimastix pyriformis TaxID=342808 RepID=A0ABQ8U5J4_9EUKA|nr:hypothetical protein PAPYR_12451 [Paratrimastix pyriformis]